MKANRLRNRHPSARFARAASVIVLAISSGVCGCQRKDRLKVEGSVTLDGQRIEKGQICFMPVPGTRGPTAGAAILDGLYIIDSEKGPMAGKFRVEITALRRTTRTIRSLNVATGQMEAVEEFESIVPARYNRDSELIADVSRDGSNKLDFALKSN